MEIDHSRHELPNNYRGNEEQRRMLLKWLAMLTCDQGGRDITLSLVKNPKF